jgi:hypothetical protein
MRLQRLAHELLRHFGLAPKAGCAAGACAAGDGGAVAVAAPDSWQALLFPDPTAHAGLQGASWGPLYPNDMTVRAGLGGGGRWEGLGGGRGGPQAALRTQPGRGSAWRTPT